MHPPSAESGLPTAPSAADAGGASPDSDAPLRQPADSKIVVDRRPDGLTLTIPCAGLRSAALGMALFAIIWLGACIAMTLWGVHSHLSGDKLLVYTGPFWAFGVLIVYSAVKTARHRAIIDVIGKPGSRAAGAAASDPLLLLTERVFFRTHQYKWTRDQIAAVMVGASKIEMNERPIPQLQIHLAQGQGKVGRFTGRDEEELEWLAQVINLSLGLDPQ
jgi:hypothetical protein